MESGLAGGGAAGEQQGVVQADDASRLSHFYPDVVVWVSDVLYCCLPPYPSGDLTSPSPALGIFQLIPGTTSIGSMAAIPTALRVQGFPSPSPA